LTSGKVRVRYIGFTILHAKLVFCMRSPKPEYRSCIRPGTDLV
jgi:hypothetical protein